MNGVDNAITLLELNRRIARLIAVEETQGVWVTAELSDVAVRGGHCYMELLQKDEHGQQVAKARGVIWANNYRRISYEFLTATGQAFATGLKLMVRVSASMHPLYGLSMQILDVNPEYTMGDLLRRRQEILQRLKDEGVLELNRQLEWPEFPNRVAVISAPGAAGYGDFINQLYNNPSHLRFHTRLFHAVMQGERAPSSIIAALEEIASEADNWDCVVIIRGGGATSDLQAFEDYELAAAIAQYPLPVMIGIGHERDITVLDYVANMRVKTPTAAAEWLINRGETLLQGFRAIGHTILQTVTDIVSASKEQLSYCEGLLPVVPTNAVAGAKARLGRAVMLLSGISGRRIAPAMERLNLLEGSIAPTLTQVIARQHDRLKQKEQMVEALSPRAVLARGYSITRAEGKTVTDPAALKPGAEIETIFASGSIKSTINKQ